MAFRHVAAAFLSSVLAFVAVCPSFADTVDLRSDDSVCKVDVEHGARIISWKVHGEELLWNPSVPQKDDGKWRHGGIPVVWPWQGGEYPDVVTNGPLHGVAWQSQFKVESRTKTECGEELAMSLEDCGLRADYTVSIEHENLRFRFKTTNIGNLPRKYAMAIHPYFYLPERNQAEVEGLDGLCYCDTRDGHSTNGVWKGVMPITQWTDHVFRLDGRPLCVQIRDARVKRNKWLSVFMESPGYRPTPHIRVFSRDAASCCVWNPGEMWAAVGAPFYGDLEVDAFRHILSVEPCTAGMKDATPLQPGESRTLTAEFARVRLL